MLCKQGARGLDPAKSTNHSHFNEISSKFSCVTTCYSGGRSEVLSPEGSTNVSGALNHLRSILPCSVLMQFGTIGATQAFFSSWLSPVRSKTIAPLSLAGAMLYERSQA